MGIIVCIVLFIYGKNMFTESYKVSSTSRAIIPILMYHHVVNDESKNNLITITDKRFKEDMDYIKENGYTSISFKELIDYKEGRRKLPDRPIIITFDDGYYNNYKYAYPILKEKNMKATIFVVGSRLGIANYNNDPRYSYFSWGEGKEMYESGLVEIQPHTYNLHYYKESSDHGEGALPKSGETKEQHHDRFSKDTENIVKAIKENIGCDSYVFAYPYGKYNDTNEEVLKDMNFKVTLTTKSKYADITDELYHLKRINVPSHKKLKELLDK
ncbi:polysaccharide deacetylase [Gottschalkia acidurici 9a]|uniref:Polysaccharide deacetylase n=2 Tax=Clostridium acidurici TaxID=1556 RepID=K0B256_GOTA9|nr:polysaccharide deacetylase [Gottschalkia acidurici 9a]